MSANLSENERKRRCVSWDSADYDEAEGGAVWQYNGVWLQAAIVRNVHFLLLFFCRYYSTLPNSLSAAQYALVEFSGLRLGRTCSHPLSVIAGHNDFLGWHKLERVIGVHFFEL